jgi:hypothetical protein
MTSRKSARAPRDDGVKLLARNAERLGRLDNGQAKLVNVRLDKAPRSKAPPLGGGTGATRSPFFTGEHGEEPPFDASEHRGT